jgi:hypothetical protein
MAGRASGSGTVAVASACTGAAGAGSAEAAGAAFGSFSGSVCGNSFAILADGLGSGTGILRPRAAGSRLFGTSITKCMV